MWPAEGIAVVSAVAFATFHRDINYICIKYQCATGPCISTRSGTTRCSSQCGSLLMLGVARVLGKGISRHSFLFLLSHGTRGLHTLAATVC